MNARRISLRRPHGPTATGRGSTIAPACHSGATALEAAIVLPVVSLLLLACADLGRVMHAQIVVTNTVRVGAEYGATHRFTNETRQLWQDRIRETMLDEIASLQNVVPDALQTNISTSQVTGNELQVQVSATYPFSLIVAWPGLPSTLQLAHTVTMRQYQ